MNKILKTEFFRRSALEVAEDLLGCVIQKEIDGVTLSGRIVETEAYLQNDPACHACKGVTPRTKAMFSAGGVSYVYLIYGMYYCFNAVTGKKGVGEAVLIRALEPLEGLEKMKEFRKTDKITNLCSGPGKLCQAFQINKNDNLQCLQKGAVKIFAGEAHESVTVSSRIGISQGIDLPYRFYLKNNQFISKT